MHVVLESWNNVRHEERLNPILTSPRATSSPREVTVDASRFDALARAFSETETRRRLIGIPVFLLGWLGPDSLASDDDVEAKPRRRKQHQRRARDHRRDVRDEKKKSKKKSKKGKGKGNAVPPPVTVPPVTVPPGAVPPTDCTPDCTNKPCGGNGCPGGSCGACANGLICSDPNNGGICQCPVERICGTACCTGAQICISGTCCPESRTCGPVCCSAGEACSDEECVPDVSNKCQTCGQCTTCVADEGCQAGCDPECTTQILCERANANDDFAKLTRYLTDQEYDVARNPEALVFVGTAESTTRKIFVAHYTNTAQPNAFADITFVMDDDEPTTSFIIFRQDEVPTHGAFLNEEGIVEIIEAPEGEDHSRVRRERQDLSRRESEKSQGATTRSAVAPEITKDTNFCTSGLLLLCAMDASIVCTFAPGRLAPFIVSAAANRVLLEQVLGLGCGQLVSFVCDAEMVGRHCCEAVWGMAPPNQYCHGSCCAGPDGVCAAPAGADIQICCLRDQDASADGIDVCCPSHRQCGVSGCCRVGEVCQDGFLCRSACNPADCPGNQTCVSAGPLYPTSCGCEGNCEPGQVQDSQTCECSTVDPEDPTCACYGGAAQKVCNQHGCHCATCTGCENGTYVTNIPPGYVVCMEPGGTINPCEYYEDGIDQCLTARSYSPVPCDGCCIHQLYACNAAPE